MSGTLDGISQLQQTLGQVRYCDRATAMLSAKHPHALPGSRLQRSSEAEKERKTASASLSKQRQKTETGATSVLDPKMFGVFMKRVAAPPEPSRLDGEVCRSLGMRRV